MGRVSHGPHLSTKWSRNESRAHRAPDPLGFSWATPFDWSNPRGPLPGLRRGGSVTVRLLCPCTLPRGAESGQGPRRSGWDPVAGGSAFVRYFYRIWAREIRILGCRAKAMKRRSCPWAWLDLGSCFAACSAELLQIVSTQNTVESRGGWQSSEDGGPPHRHSRETVDWNRRAGASEVSRALQDRRSRYSQPRGAFYFEISNLDDRGTWISG